MHSKLRNKSAVEFLGIQSDDGQAIILTFSDELQKMDLSLIHISEPTRPY